MHYHRVRRIILGVVCVASFAHIAKAAEEPRYPSSLIRLVLSTAVGGGNDTLARIVGQELFQRWGQPVVVDAKPGASGAIAALTVAKSKADGYTLLVTQGTVVSNVALLQQPGYSLSDLAPVAMLASVPVALAINPKRTGAKTLSEFIAFAKSRPSGGVFYGTSGTATSGRFVGEFLNETGNIRLANIAYKGEAQALQEAMAGHIDAVIVSLGSSMQQRSFLTTIAIAGTERSRAFPEVPTFRESGLAVEFPGWVALFAPAGTPSVVVSALNEQVNQIMRIPTIEQKILALGYEPRAMSADQLRKLMEQQLAQVRQLLADGRIKPE